MSLLRGTNASVREVALRCGVAEPRTFTRFIKRAVGLSPLEMRKKEGMWRDDFSEINSLPDLQNRRLCGKLPDMQQLKRGFCE